jgi:hypothetical protein
MEIKLFYDSNYDKNSIENMEKEINEWMNETKFDMYYHIKDIKITSEGAENGHSYMIMIIYDFKR